MSNLKIPTKLLEPLILAGCLRNPSLFLKIKTYLYTDYIRLGRSGKSYFSDEKYQFIFNCLSRFYDRYKKFPSKEELKTITDKIVKDKDIKTLVFPIIDNAYDYKEEITFEYLETELINFIKENRVYEAITKSQKDIDERNYGSIVNRMEDAVRVSFDKDLGVSIKDTKTIFDKIKKLDSENAISTGFSNFDDILDGGFHPKELVCIAATPGLGKCSIRSVKIIVKYKIDTETGEIL